jgi:hypothetical protein
MAERNEGIASKKDDIYGNWKQDWIIKKGGCQNTFSLDKHCGVDTFEK